MKVLLITIVSTLVFPVFCFVCFDYIENALSSADYEEADRIFWANITQEGSDKHKHILTHTFDDVEKDELTKYLNCRAAFLRVLEEIRSGNLNKSGDDIMLEEYNTVYNVNVNKIEDILKKPDFRIWTQFNFGFLSSGLLKRAVKRLNLPGNSEILIPSLTISGKLAGKVLKNSHFKKVPR